MRSTDLRDGKLPESKGKYLRIPRSTYKLVSHLRRKYCTLLSPDQQESWLTESKGNTLLSPDQQDNWLTESKGNTLLSPDQQESWLPESKVTPL